MKLFGIYVENLRETNNTFDGCRKGKAVWAKEVVIRPGLWSKRKDDDVKLCINHT